MKRFCTLLVLLFAFLGISAQTPTWSEDVACIIYNNCTKCHFPGGIAPNTFMTYQDVYAKRASVRIYVEDRAMPPSPALPGDVPFVNDNLLSDEERQTIIDWVFAGAPAGDLGSAPPPPTLPEGEEIDDPDAVLQIPPYTSQAISSDDYRCFSSEAGFTEDKWITAMEVVPGNESIVHHVLLFEDPNDLVLGLDLADPLPGYQCFGGPGTVISNFLGGWVPGQTAQFLPEGMGIQIPTGTNLIIQTHYPEGSEGQVDSTKINFRFAENGNDLRKVAITPYINHVTSLTNGPLFIPANETRTFRAEATVIGNVSLLSVLPHMHLIGRSMHCYAILPITNDTIEIFNIPEWDFEWQLTYHFKSPIHLPFGTKIIAEAFYDNTTANPHNPSFPPQPVSAGEATTDEMFLIFFSYLIYEAGDENIVFPENAPFSEACAGGVATNDPREALVKIVPNPANERIMISAPWTEYHVLLHDQYGRLMLTGKNLQEIFTTTLTEGMYVVSVESGVHKVSQKILVFH